MIDELRDIPGFPNYAITSDGRVWSNHKTRNGFLVPKKDKYGYLHVGLCRVGKRNMRQVHRLVLEAFVGPCPAGMEACHNNGVRTDNRVENLRWDTKAANRQDAIRQGTSYCVTQSKGECSPASKLHDEDVRIIFHAYHDGYYTQREIAEAFGVSQMAVSKICTQKMWSHLWD